MRYLSVCSGIEAASVAWEPLGFRPVAFSEIEAFPSAVLKHHYPHIPNAGDFTTIQGKEYGDFDILVGGTPCQSFSVAGKRGGLSDERGNLALEYIKLAYRSRPEFLVWENVPGVFSSGKGNDFRCFLHGLTGVDVPVPQKGWKNAGLIVGLPGHYSLAWRVLDAQFTGVPQRRRRVFVVGHLGDPRRAAAVLLERESLLWNPPPSREAGQVAPTIPSRRSGGGGLGTDFDCDGGLVVDVLGSNHGKVGRERERDWPVSVAPTLDAHYGQKFGLEDQHINSGAGLFVYGRCRSLPQCGRDGSAGLRDGDTTGRWGFPSSVDQQNAFAIQGAATRENASSGPDGIGVRTDGVAYTLEARSEAQAVAYGIDEEQNAHLELMGCLKSREKGGGFEGAVAFNLRGRDGGAMPEVSDLASVRAASGGSSRSYIAQPMAVRRLTPVECERLQGFSDGYTLIPFRNKPAADGPRYKALGNSMATPVMRWIGRRIQMYSQRTIPA